MMRILNRWKAIALIGFGAVCCAMPTGSARGAGSPSTVPSYAPSRPVVKSTPVTIDPGAMPGYIVFKFQEGLTAHAGRARLGAAAAKRARQAVSDYGLPVPVPVVSGDAESIRTRRLAAQNRVKANLPDLSLYFRVPVADPALAAMVIRELNALDEIETAFFEPRPALADVKPQSGTGLRPADALVSPNFESGQAYLNGAPGGVDARAAWTLPGGAGLSVKVTDVEYGWQLTHEDLSKGIGAVVIGVNQTGDTDHGTAVLGEIVSDRNGTGASGIAHDATISVASVATLSVAEAIDAAASASQPGDCVLIELHAPGPRYNFQGRTDQLGYVPMEYFQDNFDAILNAHAQGVIVCEAAGNGAEDLDDPIYTNYFNRAFRNSHAILCGAGNPPGIPDPDRSKLGFSNYGARVDLQGYGIDVTSCGYGDLYMGGTRDAWYTSGFSGTSSASPIVTGSVMCVSGVFRQMLGKIVDADTIRGLLVATGSPQMQPQVTRHIGPRPNLRAALGALFDPIDSIRYLDTTVAPGANTALAVTLSNSHPVRDIYLPFVLAGSAPIFIDSVSRGPRTGYFENVQAVYDNRGIGKIGYLLRADAGGGSPPLPGGRGVIAYLWVHADPGANLGDVKTVDSAWLGSSTRLRLVSSFDDGYPDYFHRGTITVGAPLCNCTLHGDINGDGQFNVQDVVGVVNVAFRGGAPAPTDPDCPHATRADYNCDGQIDILDVASAVNYIFRGGAGPCDPCAP